VFLTEIASSSVTVALSSSLTTLNLPSTVTIATGSIRGAFNIVAGAVSAPQIAIITASLSSESKTAEVHVDPGAAAAAPPIADSAVPSSGSGFSQTFNFTYSDSNGHANLRSVRVLIHHQLSDTQNACYFFYSKADNKLYLYDDASTATLAAVTPGWLRAKQPMRGERNRRFGFVFRQQLHAHGAAHLPTGIRRPQKCLSLRRRQRRLDVRLATAWLMDRHRQS
jgi:hypothetical protein